MARLRFSRRARADLDSLTLYVEADGVDRAQELVRRIDERCLTLTKLPFQGRVRPEFGKGVRSIPIDPLIVFYRVSDDGRAVRIVRVIDGRRDFGTLSLAAWSGTTHAVAWGMPPPKNDPFFEQLKADIQEGVDAGDRGDWVPAEEVWAELDAIIDEAKRNQREPRWVD